VKISEIIISLYFKTPSNRHIGGGGQVQPVLQKLLAEKLSQQLEKQLEARDK
jgi:hypothetical protein